MADPLQNIKGTYSEYNYSYYLDGNQSSVTDIFGKTKGYTYDSAGRLKYDGTGTRIGKTVNGVSTGQIWNNGNVIAEYGTKGTKTYIRGAEGEIVKTKDSANNSRYFSYNAHGDTTNIIEKNAESTSFAVTAAYEYDAFGGLATGTGGEADSNEFRYNGQYTDEETGLIYLRNRYYDPSIGRFTQEDTYWNPGNMIYGDQQFEEGEVKIPDYYAIVQSSNLYVYCANEPVNLNDIFGTVAGDRFATPDEAAIDWAWNYYGITQYSMIEHASLIYLAYDEYNTPYYSYTECVDGQPNYVQTTLLNTHINEGQYIVGAVHSHTVTNRLSNQDLDLAIDQNYSILYVVGESQYSDGVDISKIQDYDDGRGYQLEAVGSDYGFRHLTYSEQRNADVYFRNKWNWFYDEIEYNYYLKSIRGY